MKDENLKIARENGFCVPDFISIQFEDVFDGGEEIRAALENADFSDLSVLSEILHDIVRKNTHFSGDVSLSGGCFAVRSSCSAEDGKNVSFAGQFDTFLNVKKEDVPDRITDCIASLYSENVLCCARENNIDILTLKMNVIVQRMLHPELSGVLFTANPQGILNESVIVVGKGTGDGVVSDKVETTSYYYSKSDNVYYYDGRENLLDDDRVRELTALSEKLEKLFESELLDIEFAVENDSVYILQIRSITTLDPEHPTILDNSNIVESYPGISLPLTDSFVKLVYSGVFRGLASRVLKSDRIIDRYSDAFGNMVGSANGRMYYKISNWYTVIKFLPMSKKIIPVWQEMLGVKTKTYSSEKVGISPFRRVCTYFNSVYELLSAPKNMKRLEKTFDKVNADFYEKYNGELSDEELVGLFDEIRGKLLCVWDVTLLNDMYSFIFTGLVKSHLKKTNPDNFERVSAEFLSGISNIESMKPIKALAELAALSVNDRNSDNFREKYESYISLYGDRYLEELKLESRTFRTDKTLLDEKIDEYASDSGRLERLLKSDCAEKEIPKGHGIFFSYCVKKATLGIKNREISRLNRSRIFGMVRGIFLRLADSFEKKNIIAGSRDIFYLTMDEIFELTKRPSDMKETVEKRKIEYERYRLLPAYSRLIFSDKEFSKTNKYINSVPMHIVSGKLCGTPCSNGKATGEALIVTDVRAVGDVRGKILVTKMTDPGWVFLLAGASGIISEKGSLLSHTAIVSRELGIPSVVGVDNALDIFKNGDKVSIDGGNGIIEIVG